MLLRMSSGLKYNEFDFLPPADLTTMLYLEPSAADYAIRAPLAHPPDTSWAYSSATANILSQILRQAYGDDDYYRLPYRALFAKIGMRNTVVEADPAGTLVFSSYVFSTARDLARFGLLYAQDGTWLGERILPEGWTTYARTRTPTAARNGGSLPTLNEPKPKSEAPRCPRILSSGKASRARSSL
jgi:CubicO group peptidase (beta-lactamase class C family)